MSRTTTNEQGETTYKYSEIFHSFQGEGAKTGRSTAWIRFFFCNLACEGFGQKDPTDPSTYILPYKEVDISNITRIEDLPVFEYGCDSSYTWAKKYRHLAHNHTAEEICDKIEDTLKHSSNPNGLFHHPLTKQDTHMAFTGGEPMLNQAAIVDIMKAFDRRYNFPGYVTVETNGTQPFDGSGLKQYLLNAFPMYRDSREWFWSVSPKLWSTAGEKPKKAIKPDVVASYAEVSNHGQLKYVVNGSQESWDEVEHNTELFRQAGVKWDVYIMPVGATLEEQSEEQIAEIAVEAMKRGYHVAPRAHVYIFGNRIGT